MLDPVEAFMEDCSTFPGHVSRLLILMRDLDEDNHTTVLKLEESRHRVMEYIQLHHPPHEDASLINLLQETHTLERDSKSTMKEKIALENQLLHMVRYERERLSRDYQKLIREFGGDVGDTSFDSSRLNYKKIKSSNPHHHKQEGIHTSPHGSSINVSPRGRGSHDKLERTYGETSSTIGSHTAVHHSATWDVMKGGNYTVGDVHQNTMGKQHRDDTKGGYVIDGVRTHGGVDDVGGHGMHGSRVNPFESHFNDGHVNGKSGGTTAAGGSSDVSSAVSLTERGNKKQRKDKSNGVDKPINGMQAAYMETAGEKGGRDDMLSPRGGMRISIASSKQIDKRMGNSPTWKQTTKLGERHEAETMEFPNKPTASKGGWNEGTSSYSVENTAAMVEDDLWDGTCPICQKGESETQHMMVGCDACNNWFHFECVNYNGTGSEDAAWFCPQCFEAGLVPHTAGIADSKATRRRR